MDPNTRLMIIVGASVAIGFLIIIMVMKWDSIKGFFSSEDKKKIEGAPAGSGSSITPSTGASSDTPPSA